MTLEAETQFADGRLDPRERITLPARARTPGPVGFSLFDDDVAASLRDLVMAMLTISDNPATNALLHRMGIDAVNASSARLGLAGTVIAVDVGTPMSQQLTKHRLATGFPPPARVAAKSGSLVGVVRNEIGVIVPEPAADEEHARVRVKG